jgi:hypothetical protein
VTSGVAVAVFQRKATTAIVNVSRIIAPIHISLCHCRVESKKGRIRRVNHWRKTLVILPRAKAPEIRNNPKLEDATDYIVKKIKIIR